MRFNYFNRDNWGFSYQCDTILSYTVFGMAVYITELLFTLSSIVKAQQALE